MAISARPNADALGELEARVGDIADRTSSLLAAGATPTDHDRADETVAALALVAGELRDALHSTAGRRPESALALAERLVEVTELQKQLRERVIGLRFQTLARIHAGLTRLRELDSVAELLLAAPEELCRCCDFDRGLVSRVRGSTWIPEHLWIAENEDTGTTVATEEYLRTAEIPLTPMLLETELARRGAPALVTDAANDPRTHKELVTTTETRAYVAAPVMPTGRVIGFLHADRILSGRELTAQDRDNIWTFAEGFGLIFERIVLLERIEEQRERVREAFRSAEEYIDGLTAAEVKLAREHGPEGSIAPNAAGLFLPPQSRIDALLTSREREVLHIMVSGARNNQIAEQLVISEGTVKSHVKNICRKLRAENRAEAVSKYLQLVMRETR
jgi:DNA-binding CsgD family transcriptional regulator/GAF domain-containing protein